MESGGFTTDVAAGVHALRAAVDGLLDSPLIPLSDDEFTSAMREVETELRRLDALKVQFASETIRRKLHETVGVNSPARFLEGALRLSRADAYGRVNLAAKVGVRRQLGEELEPEFPMLAEAQRAGVMSVDAVRRIVHVMDRLPGSTAIELRDRAEASLTEYATTGWPDDIRPLGEALLVRVDPDGRLNTDADRQRKRGVTLGTERVDGMTPLCGEITPELRALVDPLLAKYARPGMCNPEDPESPNTAGPVDRDALEAAAKRDTRTAAQRNHDALLAFLRLELDAAKLGTHRGVPVGTILSMSAADVEKGTGIATTAAGGTLSIPEAMRLIANANHVENYIVVLDAHGMPLHLGRVEAHRLASKAQRLALTATERGCTRPGCSAPATLAAVHHVTEWANGGATDIENLTLACDACHALVKDGPDGWKTVKLGADSDFPGRTGWIAPLHMDPTGTPQVNHRHHPDEAMAASVARIQARNKRERDRLKQWLNRRNSSLTRH
ncbi:DUF222 domain-containing protein [Nocardia sp. NPDC058058]|uniref:HNH endonuclease signature motif containing protein n=1 Tax=Nocardia sp. NPDC058058 TaxID=3346317 RepID=UPI0036D929F0